MYVGGRKTDRISSGFTNNTRYSVRTRAHVVDCGSSVFRATPTSAVRWRWQTRSFRGATSGEPIGPATVARATRNTRTAGGRSRARGRRAAGGCGGPERGRTPSAEPLRRRPVRQRSRGTGTRQVQGPSGRAAYLLGVEVNRDQRGGSSRTRLAHCTPGWLTPASIPYANTSDA